MKRSTDRILTTHTGSLPRPADLTTMLEALDTGAAIEPAAFEARVRRAVADVVRAQVEAGVDVVNDGEQGKVGYSTYVRHRLTGFDGQAAVAVRPDWADFPEAAARSERRSTIMRPACNGPIDWKDRNAVQKDVANFKAALASVKPADAFMTAASPGVIAHFLKNDHYPTRDAYLARLADVMKEEYDAIHRAGFVLQIDCPDLAMGRHLAFHELSNAEFLKIAAANIEALNHAVRDIPADRMRLHLCWGNYEGPHHRDIPLRELLPVALKAKPQALSFEGANPRHEHEWVVFSETRLPDDRVIIPGVLDSTTNFIEHPELVAQRLVRYAEIVGRERVIAGTDCGFATFARAVNIVEPEIAWAKFKSMAEGARLASKQLWK
ncbi:MAG TPA: cobalamin-independent methionine synthase II family protein [Methylomirabilota bacterium]|nr:cobalamin-independent methionine synthase II family protein [Methylomirabilota bacterium]